MRLSAGVSGSWGNTEKWLDKMSKGSGVDRALHEIGSLGVKALGAATPVGETGETAKGWTYETDSDELAFKNKAHPDKKVNIAKIKELGHGTGTGGYVPPRPYMKKAMAPVWKRASEIIDKELKG